MGSDGFHERANERARALVGRTLDDRYQIDRVLAMGGMGTVYLARHLKLKKRVALKVLHPDAEDHPELFMRFEREALAGAQVTHPNVAAATDFGELSDGSRYLVMEYVRGSTLRQILDKEAPIPFVRTTRIVRQIATALVEIHKRGIVHRDLKPRNVMVMENDLVKIVDFGLAKIDDTRNSTLPEDAEDAERLTGGGMIFGTVDYLAPEAALGMELVDLRADLYALGVIAYEMLSGRRPFEGSTDLEVFTKQRTMTAAPLAACTDAEVPDELEEIVFKLLEKDLIARVQTAAELVALLDAAVPEGRLVPQAPPADLSITGAGLAIPPAALAAAQNALATAVTAPKSPSIAPPSIAPSSSPPTSSPSIAPRESLPSSASFPPRESLAAGASIPPRESMSPRASIAPRQSELPPPSSPSKGWPKTPLILAVACGTAIGAYMFTTTEKPSAPVVPSVRTSAEARPSANSATPSAVLFDAPSALPADVSASAAASASAVPSASAAPSAEPVAPSPSIGSDAPVDAAELDALDAEMADDKKLDAAVDRSMRLLPAHGKLVEDARAKATLRKVLVAAGRVMHPKTAELFERVGTTQGAAGPDLIYQLLESSGRARWAKLAERTLASEAVRKLATPELQIAFDLRFAPCNEKIPLVDVAAERGDSRSIVVLDLQARGCFKDTSKVDEALAKLRLRLKKKN